MSNNQMILLFLVLAAVYWMGRRQAKRNAAKLHASQAKGDDGKPAILSYMIAGTHLQMCIPVMNSRHAQIIVNTINLHTIRDLKVTHQGGVVMVLAPNGLLVPNEEVKV